MNHSPFWPLVWKEYRAGRAFWLAMAAMGLVAQAAVAWLAHRPTDRDWWLYGIALMISAGFAVGIGGTLFAVEHEDRTFALLRIFPVRAKELGAAKLLCALAGLIGLSAVLWLAAGALAGWQTLSSRDAGQLWGLWGLACLEGLAWGILCSLIFRSPLRATVLALLAVTLAVQMAVTLTTRHNLTDMASYSEAIPVRLGLLLVVSAIDLWLLPRWHVGRVPYAPAQSAAAKSARSAKAYAKWRSPAPRWSVPLGHLMWHAWRDVVGSVWLLVGVAVVTLLVFVFVVAVLTGVLRLGEQWLQPPTVDGLRLFPWLGLLPFVFVTCLAGSLVFRADPTSGARFLAERGVSSRLLWVARQLVWGGWILVLFLAAAGLSMVPEIFGSSSQIRFDTDYDSWNSIFPDRNPREAIFDYMSREVALNARLACAVLFSAFGLAQLVSLVVRRRLLAAVFSIFLGTIAAGWAYLMFAIAVPSWWSVLPLGVGCLLATWLRTPGWLLERTGLQGWLPPIAAVIAPLAFLAIAVPRYRADEIPALFTFEVVSPNHVAELHTVPLDWPADDSSPAAIADVKAATAAYQKAYDAYFAHRRIGTGAEEQAVAELVIEASRYRSTWLASNPRASWQLDRRIRELGFWLAGWANGRRIGGQLDKALEAYLAALRLANHFDECAAFWQNYNPFDSVSLRSRILHGVRSWAAAPGQTPQRLREAIRQIDESHTPQRSAEARLRSWYFATASAISDFPTPVVETDKLQSFSSECWITSRLPWERQRALRLASFIASAELDAIRLLESWLLQQDRIFPPSTVSAVARTNQVPLAQLLDPLFAHNPWDWSQFRTTDESLLEANQWLRTTPLVTEQSLGAVPKTWQLVAEETDFRATKIVLALEAWKADHGQLPDNLEQLVPGDLAFVPLDPVWGKPFLYYPRGVTKPPDGMVLLSPSTPPEVEEAYQEHLPPRVIDWSAIGQQPFVWSALGPLPGVQPVQITYRSYAEHGVATYYEVQPDRRRWHIRVPDNSVLEAGQAYVIPEKEPQP